MVLAFWFRSFSTHTDDDPGVDSVLDDNDDVNDTQAPDKGSLMEDTRGEELDLLHALLCGVKWCTLGETVRTADGEFVEDDDDDVGAGCCFCGDR